MNNWFEITREDGGRFKLNLDNIEYMDKSSGYDEKESPCLVFIPCSLKGEYYHFCQTEKERDELYEKFNSN